MIYNLCFFGILLVISFLIFIIMYLRNIKKNRPSKIGSINYLISKFNLDKKKLNYKFLAFIASITNAFIISFTCTVISILPLDLIWQMLIGFVMLFILIYLIYELIGRYCLKKGWKKNGTKSSKNRK